MDLTGVLETNQYIFSFLEIRDLKRLRAVSKTMQSQVETTELYKKGKVIPQRFCNMTLRQNIKGTHPTWLHSDGQQLRIMAYGADQLWNFNPTANTPPQLMTLEKIDSWKEVFWHEAAVAVAKPIFLQQTLSALDYKPTGFTTTVFNTKNGQKIDRQENTSLFPIGWHQHQLLMTEEKQKGRIFDLFAWDVLNDVEEVPKKVFSFSTQHPSPNKLVSNKKNIYCLSYRNTHPFSKIDLQTKHIASLAYQIDWVKNSPDKMRNLGVTEAGNIFFSTHEKELVLLDGETSKVICNVVLPIFSQEIIFQYPLMACYQNYEFLIYDIRKIDQPVYHHNYLSWFKQLKGAFSINNIVTSALGIDPFDDLKIRTVAFYNQSLFVSRRDDSIDHFDLAASSFLSFGKLKFW